MFCFRKIIVLGIIFVLIPVHISLAVASSNFDIDPNSINPIYFNQSSGSFNLDASLESIVGSVNSSNFFIENGSALQPGQQSVQITPSQPGGRFVCPQSKINLQTQICSQVYWPKFQINGTKDSNTYNVYINEKQELVYYDTALTWSGFIELESGENRFKIDAENDCGNVAETIIIDIVLARLGDINNDSFVNDYDLSLLANNWLSAWCGADFNLDKVVDDYDLSFIAANWN